MLSIPLLLPLGVIRTLVRQFWLLYCRMVPSRHLIILVRNYLWKMRQNLSCVPTQERSWEWLRTCERSTAGANSNESEFEEFWTEMARVSIGFYWSLICLFSDLIVSFLSHAANWDRGKNLRDEILRWIDLPVPNPSIKITTYLQKRLVRLLRRVSLSISSKVTSRMSRQTQWSRCI